MGIGTTTPAYKFSVEGIGHFGDYARASYFLATSTTATSTFSGGFSAGNNAALVVNQAATANSLYINPAGNVGIGTTSPYAKLPNPLTPHNTDPSIHANDGETNTTLFSIASSTGSATTSLFAVLNSGNIGVGTLSPARKFSVFGTSANPQLRVSYDATNYSELTVSATGDLTLSATGGDIYALEENLRICAGGRVLPTRPVFLVTVISLRRARSTRCRPPPPQHLPVE